MNVLQKHIQRNFVGQSMFREGSGQDDTLLCTNEAVTVGEDNFTITRMYDGFQRNEETAVVVTNVRHVAKFRLYDAENRVCGYALTNSLGRGVNVSLHYDGSYLTNMVYTLPNGNQFAVTLTRNASRKELVTHRDYSFGVQSVYWYATDYDIIGRPTNATDSVSLMREWQYNNRSELAAATIGTNRYGYSYDTIGNRLWSAANLATNTYAANCLNQYTSVGRGVLDPPQTSALIYDADGNMTGDGTYAYSYDAENRLKSITSAVETNGAIRVLNFYDHRNRRIRKIVQQLHSTSAPPPAPPSGTDEWQTLETHTLVWDGNNIILEKDEVADGTTRTFEYFWGLDKSGTEQSAGGVGGLLAVSMDGVFYIPCYDHNGNIVLYVSEAGTTAAQYTYDPYGNIIESSGPLADEFSFGFSTKYHDREIGMIGYQQRVYLPVLGRWLNRDPIGEVGGENLLAFVYNNPIIYCDTDGRFIMPILVIPQDTLPSTQPKQTPSVIDQLGSGTGPFHEEEWFEVNYPGWINAAKALFTTEITNAVDCKTTRLNIRSSRQIVSPGVAGNIPWEMPIGGNDRQYGDKGQNNWQTVAVLGSFAIDYVTPVMVQYGKCERGKRKFSWSTEMYVEDSLGLQGNEGWLGRLFSWTARSRRVRRARWRIQGSGTCSCCE